MRRVRVIMTALIFLTAFAGMAFAGVPALVPEVDPTAMGGAVALLAGGAMLLASRVRRK